MKATYLYKLLTLVTFFAVFTLTPASHASLRKIDVCKDKTYTSNQYRVQTGYFMRDNSKECFIALKIPLETSSNYSNYYWFSSGQLLIFSSFADGNLSGSMGSKVFYFLPQTSSLALEIRENELYIQTPNGSAFTFNTLIGKFTSFDGTPLLETPLAEEPTLMTLKFENPKNFIFELPFQWNSSPVEDSFNKVKILKGFTNCVVFNFDLFDYSKEEPLLKVKSFDDIYKILGKRCKDQFADL